MGLIAECLVLASLCVCLTGGQGVSVQLWTGCLDRLLDCDLKAVFSGYSFYQYPGVSRVGFGLLEYV